MNREKHLQLADAAVTRAERLAGHAEKAAHSSDPNHHIQTGRLAEAGALWADIARSHAAIAAALPEAETEDTDA